MLEHRERRDGTGSIPRDVMKTERLTPLLIVDLFPDSEYRRRADCTRERSIAMRTCCLKAAERHAFNESGHQQVFDLVCSEPAVAGTRMLCLRLQLWRGERHRNQQSRKEKFTAHS